MPSLPRSFFQKDPAAKSVCDTLKTFFETRHVSPIEIPEQLRKLLKGKVGKPLLKHFSLLGDCLHKGHNDWTPGDDFFMKKKYKKRGHSLRI